MSRGARAAAWTALALAALAPRLQPWSALRTSADERAAGAGTLLLDHPGTLVVLRRAALALAAGRVPASDRWLAWPDELELPGAPLLAAAVAATAELAPHVGEDEPALAGASEADLERTTYWVGPGLFLLAALAALATARALAVRERRTSAGLLAVALLAFAPDALRSTQLGRLDERALLVALSALALLGLARTFVGRDALARSGGALLGGVACGLALASSPHGLVLLACCTAVVVSVLLGRDELAAESARREGLLLVLASAVLASLPGLEGPWELAPGGALALAAERSAELAFAAGGLALLAALAPRGPRALRLALVLGPAALALWLARDGLAAQLGLARESHALALEPLEQGLHAGWLGSLRDAWSGLGPLLVLAPWSAWRLLRTRAARPRGSELRLALAALALLAALGALVARPIAAVAALPCALASALALAELAPRPRAWLSGAALVLALLGCLVALRASAAERPTRLALQLALRRLRVQSDSPGPWNAAGARARWAVLAPAALGPAIAWHARRAAMLSGPYPRGPRRARLLAALADWRAAGGSDAARLGAAWVLERGPSAEGWRLYGPLGGASGTGQRAPPR